MWQILYIPPIQFIKSMKYKYKNIYKMLQKKLPLLPQSETIIVIDCV